MPPAPGRRASGRAAQPARALATRPPLRRLLWALQRLKSGKPLRATDLAREFEVAVRTAYRDLDFLRDEWRVPLEYDHHQATYHLTEPVGSLPLVSLSQGELLAIYFAEKVLRQYRGTPFEPDLASAFAKMQELLPEEVKVSPESLDAYLSLDLGPLSTPDAAVFREILTAQRQRRRALRAPNPRRHADSNAPAASPCSRLRMSCLRAPRRVEMSRPLISMEDPEASLEWDGAVDPRLCAQRPRYEGE